jgi:KipI family sensor histidine kinase inhibitor
VSLPVLPLGDAAFTIRLGDAATVENAERAAALAESIRRAAFDGVSEIVPSVASVTVYLEERRAKSGEQRERVERALRAFVQDAGAAARSVPGSPATERHAASHVVPVRYDGADLDDVAARTGLSRDDVIARHSAREYHVLALGFLPGWAYLGPLDPALKLPRRTTPRTRIPAGSVAIAGLQTGVYPRVSPGGWHLLGTTDVVLFDPERDRPSLFRPGDRVRFEPIS